MKIPIPDSIIAISNLSMLPKKTKKNKMIWPYCLSMFL